MRNLLIVAVLLIGLSGHSQSVDTNKVSLHLEKFTKHTYTGYAFTAVGAYCLIKSANITEPKAAKDLKTFGYVITGIGAILLLEAPSHIGKAGKALRITPTGIQIPL